MEKVGSVIDKGEDLTSAASGWAGLETAKEGEVRTATGCLRKKGSGLVRDVRTRTAGRLRRNPGRVD